VTEYQAAEKVDSFRRMQEHNIGLSFDTISAGGPNGAIVHYRPLPHASSTLTNDMVHLVDSGGQYLDGTTDVTRAFHFGSPTP
jgi:Xaa-Pro aminopeptidase